MFGEESKRTWQDKIVGVGKEYFSLYFAGFLVKSYSLLVSLVLCHLSKKKSFTSAMLGDGNALSIINRIQLA